MNIIRKSNKTNIIDLHVPWRNNNRVCTHPYKPQIRTRERSLCIQFWIGHS